MVRLFAVLLLPLLLFAASIKEKVKEIIGTEKFNQSLLIINTVFANEKRFMHDSQVDMLKILQTLKKLGFIKSSLEAPQKQSIELYSFTANPLVYKLFLRSIEEAGVFRYQIDRIVQDDDGVFARLSFYSSFIADPVKITKFLHHYGAKVLSVVVEENSWRYYIDFTQARFAALSLQKELHIPNIRKGVWIESNGFTSFLIKSHRKNHWHPRIYIYDSNLNPVDVIKKTKRVKKLRLKLPKGFYYIKIADTFTIDNIKYGIDIYALEDK
ncbi:hypothetical protein NitYY0826_C1723 [Nitratiruptor sp. YY08-26]|uniref:hypothetical protein n=1 Tax=unclassified Nitratiruptor TaxID=2624044 RepID=UPI001916C08A|nr:MULTISPECIES: hypothetical protein [unclassified Nitratiruptor]BCD62838.1 hypothetical protein NitYY0813_C1721 [Nitratiruptor sp. YY08-13]BCD66774.1 hypothetical protein NitYY0826_C1723 [Nitratiruptor sp. YY08-26]